jgi:XTP/dITP diphosphohydrolase
MNIWFASGNAHKKAELASILGAQLKTPADAGLDFDPEETGKSFYENALLKARELYRLLSASGHPLYQSGDPVIADDSGLCVDALGGRPGIYSARYAGPGNTTANGKKLTSPQRNALLLEEVGENPKRSARFVCAMVLLFNEDRFYLAQETMEGEIVKGPEFARGLGGFGYDPVLFIPGLGRTVAELSEEEKNRASHRGKAGKAIAAILREINHHGL